jgi:putative hydrolase of the HAD superfamily
VSAPAAVLFDFSGTLFHVESAREAVTAALGRQFADRAPALERFGAINGSGTPAELPAALADVWAARDLSAAAHRAAYSGLSRHAGLTPEQAEAVYERGVSAGAWSPYADTVTVLARLRAAGFPIAVVSNIGWDPRPVFARWDATGLIDQLVLSYEHGVEKPDPAIFRIACDGLGVDPGDVLMIGDNEYADGGAKALGARFVLVPSAADRPADTLLRAVALD